MTPVQEFQKKHAQEYARIVHNPALSDAMTLLHLEALDKIANLSDEEIEKHSRQIVSDFRGQLRHENALMTLHERKTFDLSGMPEETYGTEETTPSGNKLKRKKE